MTDRDKLRDLFTKAAELASAVPEAMQGAAFNRAFEELVEKVSARTSRPRRARKRLGASAPPLERKAVNELIEKVLSGLSRTDQPMINAKQSALDNALRLLQGVQ